MLTFSTCWVLIWGVSFPFLPPGFGAKIPIGGVTRPNFGVDFNFLYSVNNMHGSWKHVWTIDLSLLSRTINVEAEMNCEMIDPICKPAQEFLSVVLPSIKNITNWYHETMSWARDPSILATLNRQDRDSKRKKRALLPFIGDIEKFLFGVATESDLAAMKSTLEDITKLSSSTVNQVTTLGDNLASLTKLLQGQVANSKQGFETVKATFENLTNQVNSRFHNLVNEMKNENHIIKYNTLGILHLISMLEQIFPSYSDAIKILVADVQMTNAIQQTLQGFLPFSFVPPSELKRGLDIALQGIRSQFPSASLTHSTSSLGYYYTHKLVTPYFNGDSLSLIVDIPIDLSQDILYVYAIRTFPVALLPYNPYTRNVDPLSTAGRAQSRLFLEKTHFLISENGAAWTLASDNELATCKGEIVKVCRNQFPLYKFSNSQCIERIWSNSEFSSVLEVCPYQLAHAGSKFSSSYHIQVVPLSNGRWYVECPLDVQWTITCPSRPPEMRSPCTSCIIQVDCGCGIENKYFRIPTRVSACDSVFSPLHRNFTINPFNYLPKDQPWVINLTGDESLSTPPKFQPDITLPDGGTWDDVLESMDDRKLDLNKLYERQLNETQSFRTEAEALLTKIRQQDKLLASLSGWPDWILGLVVTLTFINSGVLILFCFMIISRARAAPILDILNLVEKEEEIMIGLELVELILTILIFLMVLVMFWPVMASWLRSNRTYRRLTGFHTQIKASGFRKLRGHKSIICQGQFRFRTDSSLSTRVIPGRLYLAVVPPGSHLSSIPASITANAQLVGPSYELTFSVPINVLLATEATNPIENCVIAFDYLHRKFQVPLSSRLFAISDLAIWLE